MPKGVPLPLMPLGVEHGEIATLSMNNQTVPLPLMPLGVEHPKIPTKWGSCSCAFTFDAFRR